MENFDHSKEILNILQINEAFIFYILHNIKEMIFMTFLILLNNFYIRKFFNEIIKFSNIYIIIIFLNDRNESFFDYRENADLYSSYFLFDLIHDSQKSSSRFN